MGGGQIVGNLRFEISEGNARWGHRAISVNLAKLPPKFGLSGDQNYKFPQQNAQIANEFKHPLSVRLTPMGHRAYRAKAVRTTVVGGRCGIFNSWVMLPLLAELENHILVGFLQLFRS